MQGTPRAWGKVLWTGVVLADQDFVPDTICRSGASEDGVRVEDL